MLSGVWAKIQFFNILNKAFSIYRLYHDKNKLSNKKVYFIAKDYKGENACHREPEDNLSFRDVFRSQFFNICVLFGSFSQKNIHIQIFISDLMVHWILNYDLRVH